MGRVAIRRTLSGLIVGNVGGRPIRIRDIGHVVDGVEEPRSLARLNGTPRSCSEVRKQAGTNTLDVINSIKTRITELQKSLPADFKISTRATSRTSSQTSFQAVQEHLIIGGIFAALIVFLFMRNWRSTLIAAVAIPTSIICHLHADAAMGFTLNQITMLALVLMVGIVIDDAIVVLENVFRFMEEKNLRPMEAAIKARGTSALRCSPRRSAS